jgi:hypothetical protein
LLVVDPETLIVVEEGDGRLYVVVGATAQFECRHLFASSVECLVVAKQDTVLRQLANLAGIPLAR